MAVLKQLSPTSQLQAKPGGVDMHTALYNVRMLRAGYLYVHIDRGPSICTEDEWKGYVVHPQGYLNEFDVFLPGKVEPKIACARDARQANNSMVWVRDAKRVKKLWYLFNPDPIDYEHLKNVIAPNPGKYMQSFDVAAWANGNTSQKDTMQPGVLNGQVAEFAALANSKLQDALDPLLYGLMGSTAKERGWGDYEEEVSYPQLSPDGFATGFDETATIKRVGPTYEKAHGARLKQMADFLQKNKGAVVACDDAFGITQELGHLQPEVFTQFTYWQGSQAKKFAPGVTNEWVYQTYIGGKNMMELVKKGAKEKTEKRIEAWNEYLRREPPMIYRDTATKQREEARRTAAITHNQQAERVKAAQAGDAEFKQYFDGGAALPIETERATQYNNTLAAMAQLCKDQVAWLTSGSLHDALLRYPTKESKVDKPGGGAALSLQLTHCMSGTEGNACGQAWLAGLKLDFSDPLGRVVSFNVESYLAQLKQDLDTISASKELSADPDSSAASKLADWVKRYSAKMGLGDKAIGFVEAFHKISESDTLRKLAWPANVATLMAVSSMRTVQGLPLLQIEVKFVRALALTGVTTMGTAAQKYVEKVALSKKAEAAERARMRKATGDLQAAARAKSSGALESGGARNARAAGLGAMLDVFAAVIKGYQLGVKNDGRSAGELVQQTLQGVGNLLDWRAKAYEEAIFNGVNASEFYRAKAMTTSFDGLRMENLLILRKTAFKVLLPAAVISMAFDIWDAKNLTLVAISV